MEEKPRDTSHIDKLQEKIYQRDFKNEPISPHQTYAPQHVEVDKEWRHAASEITGPQAPTITAGSFFKKVLIGSVIFFLLSAGLLVYMFFGGWNVITANKVDIKFLGPVAVSAGSEFAFDVVVTNQNRSAIENAVMYVDYPDGTKQTDDITKDLSHEKETIGEVLSGAYIRRTLHSIPFGELNAEKQIKVTVEYGLKNSNATFRKEKIYTISISSTPVTITVTHSRDALTNDAVEFKATITSNSSVPITNLLIRTDYPFGFAYNDASPKPTYDNNIWLIPKLDPGQSTDISLTGRVQGEQGDERVVRISVGTQSSGDEKVIATKYLTQMESVFIKQSPIGLALDLNGSTASSYITDQGTIIQGVLTVKNNLSTSVVNTQVKLHFDGLLLNPSSVVAIGGFYRSADNDLVWEKAVNERLGSIEPNESVNLNFSFSTQPSTVLALKNGTLKLKASLSSSHATESGSETLTASQDVDILTKTTIGLVTRSVYSAGPFRNHGPIPPKVDTKTTYTIIWTATNSLNDVRGAEVKATLPLNTTWLGVVSPQSEVVTWNQDRNEVVWRIGDLGAGAGYAKKPPREVAFQVEFMPNLNQAETTPVIVQSPTMTAIDSFTNTPLETAGREMTTRLSTDPKYRGEEAKVIR